MKKLINKWSYNFDCCIKCGLTKYKNYSRGTCEGCRKKESYNRRKVTPEFKERAKINTDKYRRSLKFKKKLKNTLYPQRMFQRYLKNNWQANGLEIVINDKRVKTPIKPPKVLGDKTEKDNTIRMIEIFKKEYLKTYD